jgi:hypothetical protein
MKFKIVCRIFVITFFIVVVIGFYIYWKRTEPVRVAKVFIRAVENRDVDTLYLLTIPKEREELGVTPQAIRLVLETTLWRHGQVIGRVQSVEIHGYYSVVMGKWLNAKTKEPIPANYGPILNPKEMVLVISLLALTPEGWRVSTARFLVGRDFQTFGNLDLCRKVGLKGLIDVQTGYVVTLEKMEHQLALLSRPSH